jgi:hypothetical protein
MFRLFEDHRTGSSFVASATFQFIHQLSLHGRMIQAARIRTFTSRSLARGCYFILAVSWWALTLPPLIGNSGSVSINSDQSGIKWHEER